jgi:hypothetical protein
MAFNINQRLNGLEPLAYAGVNAVQPPDFVTKPRPPETTDSKNFYLGTLWLDTSGYPNTPPTNQNIWMLVALIGNAATWVNLAASPITLTGNSGGAVSPLGGNINVVGDGTTINIVGNPSTHTLTASTTGSVATSYITNPATGTAVPSAGVLTFAGAGGTVISASGSTVTITGGSGTVTGLLTQDGHTVTPTAGVIQLSGGNNISTTGTVGPNTATISLTGTTNHTVQLGNASGSLTSLANGTTGQVLTAQTGADPIWNSFASIPFTPTLSFNHVSTGITYSVQQGIYQLLGDIVFFNIGIALSSKGAAVGAVFVEGLPKNAGGTLPSEVMPISAAAVTLDAGYTWMVAAVTPGSNTLVLVECGSTESQQTLTNANMANNSAISISGYYFTA